jgi:hypothetical protein
MNPEDETEHTIAGEKDILSHPAGSARLYSTNSQPSC